MNRGGGKMTVDFDECKECGESRCTGDMGNCYSCGRNYCEERCLEQNIVQYEDGSYCKLCDPHAHAKIDRDELLHWIVETFCEDMTMSDVEQQYKEEVETKPVACAECHGMGCTKAIKRVYEHEPGETAHDHDYYGRIPIMGHCCVCAVDMDHAAEERCAECEERAIDDHADTEGSEEEEEEGSEEEGEDEEEMTLTITSAKRARVDGAHEGEEEEEEL